MMAFNWSSHAEEGEEASLLLRLTSLTEVGAAAELSTTDELEEWVWWP